jgi:hypothetical protein
MYEMNVYLILTNTNLMFLLNKIKVNVVLGPATKAYIGEGVQIRSVLT